MKTVGNNSRRALRAALVAPRYEIIPMRGAVDAACRLPAGAVVTITCSPTRGVAPTVALAERLCAAGYRAVPHLAARRFESRAHLQDTMVRLEAAGIRDVFVIGGDGDQVSGPFARGADLVAALAEIAPHLRSVGIPCYPEGHAVISAQLLDEALEAKCFLAGHMVTQLCFDVDVIHAWLRRIRARGVDLPAYIGMPGVIERRKLLGIAMRIGLGDSTRFLKKNTGVWGRLAMPSRFSPDALVDGLTGLLGERDLGIAGLHINAFNQIEATEAWRARRLAALADVADADTRIVCACRGHA